jgi:putative glycosyltransferase (TIGR04372 family)
MLNKYVWKRFLIVLKSRDYSALGRAFVFVLFRFMGLLCALPTILILYILKPIVWLKLGRLHADRLGHLAVNTDIFLRRLQLGIYSDEPFYCFFCSPKGLANRQVLTMFKRVLNIYESRILTLIFNGMLPLLKRTPFHQPLGLDCSEYYEFNYAKSSLSFTSEEIEKGRKILSQMNVDLDQDEFVCIFARDNAYLQDIVSHMDWSYHDSRDCDIDGLIVSTQYLIEKGFKVIRVGSKVNKAINFSHKNLIDYPFSGLQSEFMDVFLLANCRFVLESGASGLTNLADIFDRPVARINTVEFGIIPIGKNCLYIPKKFKYQNTKDYLHFNDALKLKESFWYDLSKVGLEAEDNSPQDMLEATQEMLARFENNFRYSPEQEKLVQAYNKLWSESDVLGSLSKTPIGIAWLTKNKHLYF